MQKVYLEKRTTDECDTIDTNVTTDTIDTIAKLNDIDLFLHGELEAKAITLMSSLPRTLKHAI